MRVDIVVFLLYNLKVFFLDEFIIGLDVLVKDNI